MEIFKHKLPSGLTVELRKWITGREKRALRAVFLKDMAVENVGGETKTTGLSGSMVEEAENLAILTVVKKIGDKTEDIIEAVLEMQARDYDALIDKVNEVTTGNDFLAD
jgi:hypothetical protein